MQVISIHCIESLHDPIQNPLSILEAYLSKQGAWTVFSHATGDGRN